jgi:hypothetical protein
VDLKSRHGLVLGHTAIAGVWPSLCAAGSPVAEIEA